jgi:hypothetical protein
MQALAAVKGLRESELALVERLHGDRRRPDEGRQKCSQYHDGRRICWRTAATFALFRSCSGTPIFRRRPSTHTWICGTSKLFINAAIRVLFQRGKRGGGTNQNACGCLKSASAGLPCANAL